VDTVDSREVLERFMSALPLVDGIARDVARSCRDQFELEDLIAYGREGLLDAARRYDANQDGSFKVYARLRIRGAIVDGVRRMSSIPRRTYYARLLAEHAAVQASNGLADEAAALARGGTFAEVESSLQAHLAAMAMAAALSLAGMPRQTEHGEPTALADVDPEQETARAELIELVRRCVDELPAQEAALVRRHYLQGEQFDDVAADLNMSKSWASKLHARALERLSKRLRSVSD
jgi:RNA polymerase sigma factor FliA